MYLECRSCNAASSKAKFAYSVTRGWDGISPVGEELQLLGTKLVLIQQDMVVAGSVGALNARMAVQVEVKLCGVADVTVHQSTCNSKHSSQAVLIEHNNLQVCQPMLGTY